MCTSESYMLCMGNEYNCSKISDGCRKYIDGPAKGPPPVPGGPTRRTPAGDLAPMSMNWLGFLRKDTSSLISALTWSMPSMSLKVSFMSPLSTWSSFAPPKILGRHD